MLLTGSNEAGEPPVELAAQPPAPLFSPPRPVVQPLAPSLPAADPSAIAALTLHGVLGGGPSGGAAIIGTAPGVQRTVRMGRPVISGVTLKSVGVGHALLATGSGDMRLEFNKAPRAEAAQAVPVAAAPTQASRRHELTALRLALEPRSAGGGVTGYRIRPGAQVPMLAATGMRPGDVLLSVGSDAIDGEERLFAIPQEIGDEPVAISFERNGRKMTGTISRESR